MTTDDKKLSRMALVALVVGSMIGSGLFSLPSKFANATGVIGGMIAWTIAGAGMLTLAFVFQTLSNRRPDLDSGIYAYARNGFGNYAGSISALGYWLGACLADVACLILISKAFGFFYPVFLDESAGLLITVTGSILLWGVHFLVLRGVREAAAINTIATVAKILPIVAVIFFAIYGFDLDIFVQNLWGDNHPINLAAQNLDTTLDTFRTNPVEEGETLIVSANVFEQARNAMLLTVFVFVGIEGASVYSRYARNRKDVGFATVVGFVSVLAILILITMLSFGVVLQADLAAMPTPSLATVLEAIVGPWGAIFVSASLIIAVLGNYLSWTLLAAEVLYSAAKDGAMPKFLAWENKKAVPAAALWASSLMIQLFLIISLFSAQAFGLAIKMTGVMTLVPYFFVAAFGAKLAITRQTYDIHPENRTGDMMRGLIASFYTLAMIYAGGQKYLLLSAILYVLGTGLYIRVRQEQGETVFTKGEGLAFGLIILLAIVGIYQFATGALVL